MIKKCRDNTSYLTEDEKVLIKRGVETDQGQNVITSFINLADEGRRIILSGSNEDKKKQLLQGLEDAVEGVGSETTIILNGELSSEEVYNKLMNKRLKRPIYSGKDIAPQDISREETSLFLCGRYSEDANTYWKTKLLNKCCHDNFLRLTFFCEKDLHANGKSFSDGVVKLILKYDCEISWVDCDQWFGFGVKFEDEELPKLKVECDTLEDGIFGLLLYLNYDVK